MAVVHERAERGGEDGPDRRSHDEEPSHGLPKPSRTEMAEEIHEVDGRGDEEQVLGADQHGEGDPPGEIAPLLQEREGEEQDPEEVPVVLEVDVVDEEERGGPQDER